MSTPILVTGDDFILPVDLTVNGAQHAVDMGSTVKAAVVSDDGRRTYMDAVTQSSAFSGANWPIGHVMIAFTAEQTAQVGKHGAKVGRLEIQVAGATKDTWFVPIKIVRGTID